MDPWDHRLLLYFSRDLYQIHRRSSPASRNHAQLRKYYLVSSCRARNQIIIGSVARDFATFSTSPRDILGPCSIEHDDEDDGSKKVVRSIINLEIYNCPSAPDKSDGVVIELSLQKSHKYPNPLTNMPRLYLSEIYASRGRTRDMRFERMITRRINAAIIMT